MPTERSEQQSDGCGESPFVKTRSRLSVPFRIRKQRTDDSEKRVSERMQREIVVIIWREGGENKSAVTSRERIQVHFAYEFLSIKRPTNSHVAFFSVKIYTRI